MPKNEKKTTLDIDALVASLYASPLVSSTMPTIPTVESVTLIEEKNKAEQINGLNIAIVLSGISLVIGREICFNGEQFALNDTNMRGFRKPAFPDNMEFAKCASVRLGAKDSEGSTYLLEHVANVPDEVNAFAEKICALADAHGIDALIEAGHVIKTSRDNEYVVQFDASRVQGITLHNFCSIGEDGKPVIDFTKDWSFDQMPARASVYRANKDTGELDYQKNRGYSFRGHIFQKSRARQVVMAIQEQVLAKVGEEIAKVTGVPYKDRHEAEGKGKKDLFKARRGLGRFTAQVPVKQEQTQDTPKAANATDVNF